ncbi:YhdT family protein [Eubacterium sp. ER2]|uniref:YhdT family protein n=1 Tax=Eubacterium sp. ER2 TaxID=1519438 RepID=UPI00068D042D|nr:YhdT family protein [Eubacterium sp. ER2]
MENENKKEEMSYKEKFIQMNKEAKATWIVAAISFIVWLAGGFGIYLLVGNSWTILGMPAWFVIGSFGCWFVGIIGVVYLLKFVFKDFDLGHDEEDSNE